jgi:type IV pilus assembly protein PilY1
MPDMISSVMKTRKNSRSAIMKRLYAPILALVGAIAGLSSATAEDIDLFVQPQGGNVGLPNVLIILDNTANWNTPFTNEIAALASTVSGLSTNSDGSAKFRLGLMLFTETGGGNSNVDGGYVRAAIRDLTSANKAKFVALVNSLDKNADKSNGGKAGKTMAEAYVYFSGLAPYTGNNKNKTDYTNNTSGSAASNAIYALPNNALGSKAGSPYTSPLVNGSCAGNFIIYISNGAVQDNSSDNSTASTWLQTQATAVGLGTNVTQTLPISPSGSMSNVADEWARFMKKSPRGITVYTVDVNKVTTGQGPGWTALLKSMANVTDGKYFDVNSAVNAGAEITTALGKIFSEIQAVNSVFASVSLPTSVNTEGTYLNQVYIGMFRPDPDAFPRWYGNMKQYKLALLNGLLKTVDADGADAINTSTGFITECARSYWTPTISNADTYWSFKPQGGCTIGTANYDSSNTPDGKIVEKGAQAYVRRTDTGRTLLTCSSTFTSCDSTGDALIAFNSTNVTQALLGTSATDHAAVVNYQLGFDVNDEQVNGNTSEIRPSVHGDVVHTQPLAINYGDDDNPKTVVYYAGNDGVLRAVNGNRSANIGTGGNAVVPGQEIWGFVPPEFFGNVKRLKENSPTINFQGTTVTSPTPLPKPYGMDGAITAYNNNYLYVTMRRGGRVVYAFNVTGVADNNPADPTLLWKKGCPNLADDTGCSSGFTGIGQTWAAAKVLKSSGYVDGTGAAKPMIILGGGYDTCEDADTPTDACKSTGKGHVIYVLDGTTGDPLKTFTTDRGVVADVMVVTDTNTGIAQWAYAVDLGGNVYRISGDDANTPLTSSDPADWTITKIASLGCGTISACSNNRKFMNHPDIVLKNGTYYILLGSGDREKPLDAWPNSYAVSNYFFQIQDRPSEADWLTDACSTGVNMICLDSLVQVPDSGDPDPDELAAAKGWYLALRPHEQVISAALTFFGNTVFSTHTPTVPVAGSCQSNLGTARVYNVLFSNGNPGTGQTDRSQEVPGGGILPSAVGGIVKLDDGTTVPFCIGCSPESGLGASEPEGPASGTQPKSLTYWYIEKQ